MNRWTVVTAQLCQRCSPVWACPNLLQVCARRVDEIIADHFLPGSEGQCMDTDTHRHTCLKCVSVCHLPAVLSSLWLFPPSLPPALLLFSSLCLSLTPRVLYSSRLLLSCLHFFIDAVVSPSSSLVLPLLLNHPSLLLFLPPIPFLSFRDFHFPCSLALHSLHLSDRAIR